MASAGSVLGGRELKKTASLSGAVAKRPKVGVADLGSGVRLGAGKPRKMGLFKVPQLPLVNGKTKGKEKERPLEGEPDVFGGSDMSIDDLNGKPRSEGKGKRKRSMHDNEAVETEEIMETERANKNVCSHVFPVFFFPRLWLSIRPSSGARLTTSPAPKIQPQLGSIKPTPSSRNFMGGCIEELVLLWYV